MKGREIILFTKTRMYLYCFFLSLSELHCRKGVYSNSR